MLNDYMEQFNNVLGFKPYEGTCVHVDKEDMEDGSSREPRATR